MPEEPTPTPRLRLGFVDALRGFVMLLVVVDHVAGGVRNAGIPIPGPMDSVMDYSYSFFMPLMFLLSGLFIESAVRKGPRPYALSRLGSLVYPFVLWSLVNGAVQVLASRLTNHQADRNPLAWLLWDPVGPLWFLEALILCHALYGLLRFARLRPSVVAAFGTGLTGVSLLLPDSILTHSLFSFGFFAVGAAFSAFVLERLPQASAGLLVAVSVGFEALHLALIRAPYPATLVPVVAVVGMVPVLCVGVLLGNVPALSFLRTLGTASLAVFVLHTLVAAPSRIVLQKAFHVSSAWPHLLAGVVGGLVIPVLVWERVRPLAPWLFQWPTARRPDRSEPSAA